VATLADNNELSMMLDLEPQRVLYPLAPYPVIREFAAMLRMLKLGEQLISSIRLGPLCNLIWLNPGRCLAFIRRRRRRRGNWISWLLTPLGCGLCASRAFGGSGRTRCRSQ